MDSAHRKMSVALTSKERRREEGSLTASETLTLMNHLHDQMRVNGTSVERPFQLRFRLHASTLVTENTKIPHLPATKQFTNQIIFYEVYKLLSRLNC